jgi:adenine/guanine phosphoribosyltransferase-like PRPP-binding protein
VSSSLRARLENPVLRASATTRALLGLAIVFDMVVKPAAVGAVIALVVALMIGAATVLARKAGARGALAANE